jgi:hypothetical protein
MKITLPADFQDITLDQYQQWHKGLDKFKGIALFSDVDLRKASVVAIDKAHEHLTQLIEDEDPRFFKVVTHKDIDYGFINDWDKLTGGEWIDIENYSKDLLKNAHKIMSIIYRPIERRYLDKYSIVPYEGSNDDLKDVPASWFLGAMVFFCESETEYLNNIQQSLMEIAQQMILKNDGDGIV